MDVQPVGLDNGTLKENLGGSTALESFVVVLVTPVGLGGCEVESDGTPVFSGELVPVLLIHRSVSWLLSSTPTCGGSFTPAGGATFGPKFGVLVTSTGAFKIALVTGEFARIMGT